MSVREELRESLLPVDRYPAPGEAEDVDRLLDAYRAEVLREVAQKVRDVGSDMPVVMGRHLIDADLMAKAIEADAL